MQQTMEYPTINLKATGARIAYLRKEAGITVAELSRYMGFNEPQAIYKWQRGESLPTVDNLFALSRRLGTTIEDILVSNDEMSSRLLKAFWRKPAGSAEIPLPGGGFLTGLTALSAVGTGRE